MPNDRTKFGNDHSGLDPAALRILDALQHDCKLPLAEIGKRAGLAAPTVVERIRKLEDAGVIRGYAAVLDARKLGKDITAFIGVTSAHASLIENVELAISSFPDVLEIHHVTGIYTFLIKVKTENTASLEVLLRAIRNVDGVDRSETMIVLSTHTERWTLPLLPAELSMEGGARPEPGRAKRGSDESTSRGRP